jgi:alcohol dehydrogenase (NADP+)
VLPTKGYAQLEKGGRLQPWKFERRNPRPDDVAVKILYSGICHTDIHALKDGWGQEIPLVPGHEIMGEVTNLGSNVKDFERGDHVLIGTMVDSCRVCQQCKAEMESYCRQSPTYTYDSLDRVDGTRTRGGYSDTYVADKRFVYHLPKGMNGAAAAPLVCAGITTYSPLRQRRDA